MFFNSLPTRLLSSTGAMYCTPKAYLVRAPLVVFPGQPCRVVQQVPKKNRRTKCSRPPLPPHIHTRGSIVSLLPSQALTCARRRLHSVFPLCLLFPPAASERLTPEDRGRRRTTGEGRRKRGVFPRRLSAHAPGLSLSLSLAFFLSVFRRPPDWVSLSFGGDGGGGGGGGGGPRRRQTSDPGTRQKRSKPKEEKGGRRRAFLVVRFFF